MSERFVQKREVERCPCILVPEEASCSNADGAVFGSVRGGADRARDLLDAALDRRGFTRSQPCRRGEVSAWTVLPAASTERYGELARVHARRCASFDGPRARAPSQRASSRSTFDRVLPLAGGAEESQVARLITSPLHGSRRGGRGPGGRPLDRGPRPRRLLLGETRPRGASRSCSLDGPNGPAAARTVARDASSKAAERAASGQRDRRNGAPLFFLLLRRRILFRPDAAYLDVFPAVASERGSLTTGSAITPPRRPKADRGRSRTGRSAGA